MDKQMYKQLVAEYMRRESTLKTKVEELELKLEQKEQDYYFDLRNKHMKVVNLEQENTKLRIALCNLRDEYLDMGGDPNQLELFDEDNVSQLNLDFEVVKTSDNDFEVKR